MNIIVPTIEHIQKKRNNKTSPIVILYSSSILFIIYHPINSNIILINTEPSYSIYFLVKLIIICNTINIFHVLFLFRIKHIFSKISVIQLTPHGGSYYVSLAEEGFEPPLFGL